MEKYSKVDSDPELSSLIDDIYFSKDENELSCEPNDSWNKSSNATGRLEADSTHLYGANESSTRTSVSTLAFTNNPVGSNQMGASMTTSTENRASAGMYSSTFSDTNTLESPRGVMEPSLMYLNENQQHYTSQWGQIRGLHCSSVVGCGQPMPQFMSQSYGNINSSLPYEPVQRRPQQITEMEMNPISQQNFYNCGPYSMGGSSCHDDSSITIPSLPSASQTNSSRSNTSDELRQPQNEQESSRTSFSSVNMFSEVQESSVSIINSVNKLNTNTTGRFACSVCGKEFTSERILKGHQYYAHDQKGPFECNICREKITGKKRFYMHVRRHSLRGLYVCRTCGKHYRFKCSLTNHQRMHTSEESLECGGCGATFTDSNYLVAHQNTQTSGGPFTCEKCGEEFVLKCALEVHEYYHPREGPHECGICNKKFWTKNTLYDHRHRKHPPDRQFKCQFCGKAFIQRHELQKHQTRCNSHVVY